MGSPRLFPLNSVLMDFDIWDAEASSPTLFGEGLTTSLEFTLYSHSHPSHIHATPSRFSRKASVWVRFGYFPFNFVQMGILRANTVRPYRVLDKFDYP